MSLFDPVAALADRLIGNVETVISGKRDVVRLAVVCLLARGHMLVEDVPGTGKTTLVRALATSVGADWRRIQFTPDLLPSDVTGVEIWNAASRAFEFHEGPVFAQVVIADEINRASPKTQAALLEVMEERRVTVDGVPRPVPQPFLVVATQNPVEMDGTYRLPEAQLDRFLIRVEVGYPDIDAEAEVLARRGRGDPMESLSAVIGVEELQAAITAAAQVAVSDELCRYVAQLAATSRRQPELRLGVSPRGSLALLSAARSAAAIEGRGYVVAEDLHALAAPVLAHRILLAPQAELEGVRSRDVLTRVIDSTPTPTDPGRILR